jgi:cold shock protein
MAHINMTQEQRTTGTVKWFDGFRGFGFIDLDDGRNVFVHYAEIDAADGYATLEAGDRVSLQVQPHRKGPRAAKVRVTA